MNKYKYKIKWYNERDDKIEDISGFVFGETYLEAMKNLIGYYGNQEIEKVSLKCVDDTDYPIHEIKNTTFQDN